MSYNIRYKIFDKQYKKSTGIYNKHKFTDDAKLQEIDSNLTHVASDLGANHILILNQVHGRDVICIDKNYLNNNLDNKEFDISQELERLCVDADGAITNCTSLALTVQTADCVPVLFYCDNESVIGAAHCGWRSAKSDIISNISEQMNSLGGKNIKAIIGPAISRQSYEVDEQYYQKFIRDSIQYSKFFSKKDASPYMIQINQNSQNFYLFDLVGFVKSKLLASNIEIVKHIDEDTYTMKEKYPSYRRSCHTSEHYNSSILSTIVILPN